MRIAERKRERKRRFWIRVWRSLEGLGIAIAIGTGALAWQANQIAAEALRDQRVAAAWQMLSAPQGIGRRYALEALVNDTDERLYGIDFGCPSEVNPDESCENRADLSLMHLDPKMLQKDAIRENGTRHIKSINIRGANIDNSFVKNVTFTDADFSYIFPYGTIFYNTDFVNSKISTSRNISHFIAGRLFIEYETPQEALDDAYRKIFISRNINPKGVLFENCKLTETEFSSNLVSFVFKNCYFVGVDFSKTDISGVRFINEKNVIPYNPYNSINISDTIFCIRKFDKEMCATGLDENFFDSAYYIEGHPPIGVEVFGDAAKGIRTCDDFYLSQGIITTLCEEERRKLSAKE